MDGKKVVIATSAGHENAADASVDPPDALKSGFAPFAAAPDAPKIVRLGELRDRPL